MYNKNVFMKRVNIIFTEKELPNLTQNEIHMGIIHGILLGLNLYSILVQ